MNLITDLTHEKTASNVAALHRLPTEAPSPEAKETMVSGGEPLEAHKGELDRVDDAVGRKIDFFETDSASADSLGSPLALSEMAHAPVLKSCVWLRLRCPKCGIYEIRVEEAPEGQPTCHHCAGAEIDVVALCWGKTVRSVPFIAQPSKRFFDSEGGMLPNPHEKLHQHNRKGGRRGKVGFRPGRPKFYDGPREEPSITPALTLETGGDPVST